ncbi:hypothetical protein ACNKHU_25405 [Shigella flexneri]
MNRRGFCQYRRRLLGTAPQHLAAMRRAVEGLAPRKLPEIPVASRFAGLGGLKHGEDSLFVNVGERTNVTVPLSSSTLNQRRNTARHWMWPRQVENGAPLLDIDMDEGMLDARSGDGAFSQSDCR